jgi:molybdopterin-dependent oxidoreductase alpha subunit
MQHPRADAFIIDPIRPGSLTTPNLAYTAAMRDFSPEPPLEAKGPRVGDKPEVAGGLSAAINSLVVSLRQLGPGRTYGAWRGVNKTEGFDCPGCAWADPDGTPHVVEFCENGAKAFADDASTRICGPELFARYSVAELAQQSDLWLNAQGRIPRPMFLAAGEDHYRPIGWDDAFGVVAGELRACTDPNQAVFYTSGKAINESAFLFQLLARRFGTNNLPDCSNMCHESSGVALKEALGAGKATVTLQDLEGADVIVIIGQNPGTNHPRMLASLQVAKKRGARIIAINPLKEVGLTRFIHPQDPLALLGSGTALADLYLQVRINGDVALLQGLAKCLLAAGVMDQDFVETYAHGFAEYRQHIEAADWNLIVRESGISRSQIEEAAAMLAKSRGTVACWAMGLTQHENALDNIRELTNLLLIGGHIGRPNAGLFCVRGHSNVQGDRTMGIAEHMPESFYAGVDREFGISCPRARGSNTVEAIEAMLAGRVRVFVSLGGNFLSATPDTHAVARGLRQTRLSVSIATRLNRSHLVTGDAALILPCLSRTELNQTGSVENTVSWVSPTRGIFPPISRELRSEAEIVAGIADALFSTDWGREYAGDYRRLREKIARIVPGFENYNERLDSGGFYAPVPPKQREFRTASGKAEFAVCQIQSLPLQPGQLVLTTIRTHDQFNTVVYGNNDRYRGIHNGRRVVFMNLEDVRERGLRAEQLVDLTSHYQGETRTARGFRVVPYDLPRGNAATYFPEANPLVPLGQRARGSMTPASKSVIVSVAASKVSYNRA